MLPKPDKSSKKAATQQLDFVDSISQDNKVHHKRRIVIIALILTIGTSFGLWTYRSLKSYKFNFSLPKINIPVASTTANSNPDLNSLIDPLISVDPNSWSFYLVANSSKKPPFYWQKDSDNLIPNNNSQTIINSLKQAPPKQPTSLDTVLPPGAEIKQKIITDKPNQFQVYYLITIPENEFFIAVDISGSNNLDTSKKLLPSVIEKLYWTLVTRSN
jgi:hypothetical protein